MGDSNQYDLVLHKLDDAYKLAHEAGDVFFFPSTTFTHEEGGVEASHALTVYLPMYGRW